MAKSAEKKEVKKSEPAAEPRQSKAIARYMRIAPRKLRRVIQSVRRKPVYKAMEILGTLPQKGARLAGKVLKSAIANAKVQGLDANCLIVKEFRADCAQSFDDRPLFLVNLVDHYAAETSHPRCLKHIRPNDMKFRMLRGLGSLPLTSPAINFARHLAHVVS